MLPVSSAFTPWFSGEVMHSIACIASSLWWEYSLTPTPMPPYGGRDASPCVDCGYRVKPRSSFTSGWVLS